ncbi:sialidase-1 [Anseongella ginsenosidimutans]|uniref:exo-alpha-sialidase n=1 Tax=Anseongella ginsenosidimutans TaxID=496056 RepID=A0A4R3KN48_9SPHI|nr:sialidase family protein [Anseongella ginsenosidimutans]QEC52387.1 sialidase [Anseongella ginsenosidimutans]TCS85871.1 sialidase-1 [Anseongella ginsenosidimutans]
MHAIQGNVFRVVKYFLFIAVLLFPSQNIDAQHANLPFPVTQRQFQLPVLKNKPRNPVLRIRITADAPVLLTGLTLTAAGTSRLRDLHTVSVYYRGTDSLAGDLASGKAKLFGAVSRPGEQMEVSGKLMLEAGTHYFWVAADLDPAASLDHLISISGTSLILEGKEGKESKTLPVPPVARPVLQRVGVAVRQHGQDGTHTARIPGLVTTNKGTLLAIFDARHDSARDLQGNMDIGLHRSTDGGATWEPIRIVLDQKEWGGLPEKFNGVSDACILVDRNSDVIYIAGLWMHGVINPEGEWVEGLNEQSDVWNHQWRNKASQPGYGVKQTSQFLLVKSTDDGKTWSKPVNITRMGKKEDWWLWAPAPGRGITLKDGTLVFPTQGRDASGKGFSTVTYSKDGGETWITGSPATMAVEVSTTECAVVQLGDGSLMLNMRSGKNKGNTGDDNGRPIAVSQDMGKTWQEHPASFGALPEPTCMASLYKHTFLKGRKERSILLFSNPNSKTHRENMTIKTSFDDGNTWPVENQVLLDEWRGRGYSCLTSVDEDHIGILYESSQADLVFQRIPLSALLNQ